jgi:hypothetical protein
VCFTSWLHNFKIIKINWKALKFGFHCFEDLTHWKCGTIWNIVLQSFWILLYFKLFKKWFISRIKIHRFTGLQVILPTSVLNVSFQRPFHEWKRILNWDNWKVFR